MEFEKPPLTVDEHIALLRSNGLVINDEDFAKACLTNIGYYRLARHWEILQKDRQKHLFFDGVTFEKAVDFYNLDRELRMLVFSGIEVVEVGFKARVNNVMSLAHGAFWFENAGLFDNRTFFDEALVDIDNEIERSSEDFLFQHKHVYGTSNRPPSWKVVEVLSLGTISKMYKNISVIGEKNEIAASMLLPNHRWVESWLLSISVLRNLCAHHSRIYGKWFPFPPKEMAKAKGKWIARTSSIPDYTQLLYYQICAVKYLLNTMSTGNVFTDQLKTILQRYEGLDINFAKIGMEKNWYEADLWN